MNLNPSTSAKTQAFYQQLINTPAIISDIPPNQRMHKTWATAKRRGSNEVQERTNSTVEILYTSMLSKAKRLLGQAAYPVFERDYRQDRTESALAMHCFMSSNCYLRLECDALYNYRVEYAFHHCHFEQVIRAMLVGYPFDTHSAEVKLRPDFTTFYHRVLQVQDSKYITYNSKT
jgi:hypothetical protein